MSKLSGNQLRKIFSTTGNSHLLSFSDSAVIPKLDSDILITTDFGPLVGNNCHDAGRISVLNALSDIYVMGGIPLYASVIFIVGEDITDSEREDLFRSISETCKDEGVIITGGHTIVGEQTIIGITAIGTQGDRIIPKNNCSNGDVILISKPIGSGIILRALYDNVLNEAAYHEIMASMKMPNIISSDILTSPCIHAATDVTGFGLLGSLSEMINDDQGATIMLSKIPFFESLRSLSILSYDNEFIQNNLKYARARQKISFAIDSIEKLALFDPQTNGPIILCADPDILKEDISKQLVCIGNVIGKNGFYLN